MRTPITMTKNDNIEEQDDKDGTQKGSKEYCRIRDEATKRRKEREQPLQI